MNSQTHLCLNVKFPSILKPSLFSYFNPIFVIPFCTLFVCVPALIVYQNTAASVPKPVTLSFFVIYVLLNSHCAEFSLDGPSRNAFPNR